MKKTFLLIFLCFVMVSIINAQERKIIDNDRINSIQKELKNAFSKIETIECDYIHEKSVSMLEETLSTIGHVVYWNPKRLYWSANESFEQSFVMNGDSIKIINANGKEIMPIDKHLIFKEISKIINNSESQNSFIDNNNFDSEYFDNDNDLIIKMKPKKNRLKNVIQSLVVYLNTKTYTVEKIYITDENGDIITITLSNQKINKVVDFSLFDF